MNDREKVLKGLECLADIQNETCTGCGYIGIGIYPICVREVSKDALVLLKEDYRSWLMDMFHKYGHDEFIALLVDYGEENLIADMLKGQEAVKPRVSSVEQRCGNCNKIIEMDGWKACPWCGKMIDWEGR